MEGATRSGYYILDSDDVDSKNLKIARCDMNLPYFDENMETEVGQISVEAPARFVVEQTTVKTWAVNSRLTFSNVLKNDLWTIDATNGLFVVPKTATYVFVLSGTASNTDAAISMEIKSGEISTSEQIYETSSGDFHLKEIPLGQITINYRYTLKLQQ
jgi:hypothetical protein